MRAIVPKHSGRYGTAAVIATLILFCILAGAASVRADPPSAPLPDVLSMASKEAFELLTTPRVAPADMTIKVIGDQKHWSYTYVNPPGPAFNGSANASIAEQPDLDPDIVVPQGKSVELLVTANDQIYQMSFRELGVSLVAIPGRLETFTLLTKNLGRLVAVCSADYDGLGQADAIVIRVVSPEEYEQWSRNKMKKKQ
jgi:cytochrome c oxidase subunit II